MSRWKKLSEGWRRLMDGHGFALLVTICVAVITMTAIWSSRPAQTPVIPTLPPDQERQASALQQQSLLEAATPTPLPDSQPILWQSPLEGAEVLRAFHADVMVPSGVTGLWAVHPAVDLSAEAGTPVLAMADGHVAACGEDALTGHWIEVEHRNGCTSRYAGLALLSALREGDPVKAGQTLGFVGNGMLNEADLGPHLHLEVHQQGVAIDPTDLFYTED